MSRTGKTAVLVVAVVVIVGLWWLMSRENAYAPTADTNAPSSPASGSGLGAGTAPTSAQNTSDAGLEQDMASIDAQLNTLGSDSAAIDQSMNDKPVEQENP